MIARVTGTLERLADGIALLATGAGLCYEVHVPACDVERLSRRVGQEVALHTIHYVEGDPARGGLTPRLVGFLAESDREFFRLFTTVKGVGIRKALRALARPAAEVAAAVEAKDIRLLVALPEIGRRLAERIITELHGKLGAYAGEPLAAPGAEAGSLPEAAREAVAALVQLGERRADAAALVERVLAVAPEADSAGEIIQLVYRLKGGSL